MNPKSSSPWKKVRENLKKRTPESLKMAVIETHSLLVNFLKSKGAKTNSLEEISKVLKTNSKNLGQIKKALDLYQKIIAAQKETLTYEEAKANITAYYQTMLDLDQDSLKFEKTGLIDITGQARKLLHLIDFRKRENKFKIPIYSLVGILAFFLFVIFLSETSPGQFLVLVTVKIAKATLFSFLPALFILIAILIMVIGSIYYASKHSEIKDFRIEIKEEDED